MKRPSMRNSAEPTPNAYWMRSVSFAGLHRLLMAVASAPEGLRARELNALVLAGRVALTEHRTLPKPTTLYHYRNTLVRLGAVARRRRRLHANAADPDVAAVLNAPAPVDGDQSLGSRAREHFANLVLKNPDCRALFFDLFLPSDDMCSSAADFRERGVPVTWTRRKDADRSLIVFHNPATGRSARYARRVAAHAVLYGLRYWARDELALVDEHGERTMDATTLFPVAPPSSSPTDRQADVLDAVHFLLSLRSSRASGEWTTLAVSDLIREYCETHRRPRTVLFGAFDWLQREWPGHVHLAPTPLGLATIAATSAQQQNLALRRYYKPADGPYISHVSFHRDVTAESRDPEGNHVRLALNP